MEWIRATRNVEGSATWTVFRYSLRLKISVESSLATLEPLVVAHGAFNRCLLAHALGLPMSVFRDAKERFVFANCECVELEWRADGSNAHADRWRRRVPTPSAWSTGGEERARLEGAG